MPSIKWQVNQNSRINKKMKTESIFQGLITQRNHSFKTIVYKQKQTENTVIQFKKKGLKLLPVANTRNIEIRNTPTMTTRLKGVATGSLN